MLRTATDIIAGRFPPWNGSRLGVEDYLNQHEALGYVGKSGVDIHFDESDEDTDEVPDSQASHPEDWRIGELAHRLEQNNGAFSTAGYLQTFTSAPHGACLWLKLHFGQYHVGTHT